MSLFHELIYNFDHEGWNEYDIPKLKLTQIQFLCRLLGAPYSGTKEFLTIRLLTVRQIRKKLSPFDGEEGMRVMVKEFRKEDLRWMAKQNCLWRSGNKKQLAIVLLNWRNKARLEGAAFFKEQFELSKTQPYQLELSLT